MAIMLTGNKADAEDLVQAALAKTFLAWDKIDDDAALDAYGTARDDQHAYIVVAAPSGAGIPDR